MYAGRDFSPSDDQSAAIYGFDLSATMPAGATILAAQSKLILESGADDAPETHVVGLPQIGASAISQMLFWGNLPLNSTGNSYAFFVITRLSDGQIIIPWSRIQIEEGFGKSAFVGAAASHAAIVSILPMPGPLFILPALGGYTGQDFSDMDQGESRFCGFNFSGALSPGEEVLAVTAALSVVSGSDPIVSKNPIAYFTGSPILSGPTVQQLISIPPAATLLGQPPQVPDLRGVVYAFSISARTSFGQAITAWSRLRVRSFYG